MSCSAASNGTYACTVPNGWTGLLHAHAPTASSLQIREQSFTNVTSNQSGQNPVVRALGSCNLDVDNNGLFEPDIDGVAILRRVAGLNAGAFSGLSGACAGNTTAASVYAATNSDYNVTLGAGGPRLLSDGLIISRAMKKLTGTAVTNGATSIPWSTLQSWLNTHCGTTF